MIDIILESRLKRKYHKYLIFCFIFFLSILSLLVAGFLLNNLMVSIAEIVLVIILAYFLIRAFGLMKKYHESLLLFYDELACKIK